MNQKIPYIHQIKLLRKWYRSNRSVHYELTPQQAQQRVDICHQLINNPMDVRFIRKIITCDEKWIYYSNPDTSKQWLSPLNLPKLSLKNQFGSKVMCVWWNFQGVIHWEFVPNRPAVDVDLYSQQLEQVHEILRRWYQALGQCEIPYWMNNNHDKNSGIGRNKTAIIPSIQPWYCAFTLPSVSIHGPFLAWKKFWKVWSCGSESHRILCIKH